MIRKCNICGREFDAKKEAARRNHDYRFIRYCSYVCRRRATQMETIELVKGDIEGSKP